MKSVVFKGEQERQRILDWFERFRGRIASATESHTVATRFGETHVLAAGKLDGPRVVVLHGAMASSAHVMVELQPLLRHYRVYAVDIVGQSVKSADARPDVRNNEYGDWLCDVLDALGLDTTFVVGVSWGGFVAIRLAAVAPERITRLALLVPAGIVNGSSWEGLTKIALPMMLYRMFPSEKRLRTFMHHLLTTTDDDWLPYLGDAFLSYRMDMRVPVLARPDELARFTAPTMIVGGDLDLSFPGARMRDRAPQLFRGLEQIEVVPNCRHCPPTTEEFRAWLSERIDAFFGRAREVRQDHLASRS